MGIVTVLPEVNQSVSATSSSYVYFWLTRYIACMGLDILCLTWVLAGCTGKGIGSGPDPDSADTGGADADSDSASAGPAYLVVANLQPDGFVDELWYCQAECLYTTGIGDHLLDPGEEYVQELVAGAFSSFAVAEGACAIGPSGSIAAAEIVPFDVTSLPGTWLGSACRE